MYYKILTMAQRVGGNLLTGLDFKTAEMVEMIVF